MTRSRDKSGLGLLIVGVVVVCVIFSVFPQILTNSPLPKNFLGDHLTALTSRGQQMSPATELWANSYGGKTIPVTNGAKLNGMDLSGFTVKVNRATTTNKGQSLVVLSYFAVDGKEYEPDFNDQATTYLSELAKRSHAIKVEGTYRVCTQSGCGEIIPFDPLTTTVVIY